VSGYLYAPCVALRAAPCAARAPVKAPRPTRSRAGRWRAWAWSRCTSRAPARNRTPWKILVRFRAAPVAGDAAGARRLRRGGGAVRRSMRWPCG